MVIRRPLILIDARDRHAVLLRYALSVSSWLASEKLRVGGHMQLKPPRVSGVSNGSASGREKIVSLTQVPRW